MKSQFLYLLMVFCLIYLYHITRLLDTYNGFSSQKVQNFRKKFQVLVHFCLLYMQLWDLCGIWRQLPHAISTVQNKKALPFKGRTPSYLHQDKILS
jgi:hypothetical protein